jgi:RimJ/RimL family protein N-acetyltransferase
LPQPGRVTGLGFWVGFADGAFVGWSILQPPNGPDQSNVSGEADLGCRLRPEHWRRGYATEAAREMIRYGFAVLGLSRIFAQTLAVNAPSRATMSAAGLTFARAYISGEPGDDPVKGAEHAKSSTRSPTTWQRRRGLAGFFEATG